jgi:hypothetical protein
MAASCASPFYRVAVELCSRTQKYAPLRFSESALFGRFAPVFDSDSS